MASAVTFRLASKFRASAESGNWKANRALRSVSRTLAHFGTKPYPAEGKISSPGTYVAQVDDNKALRLTLALQKCKAVESGGLFKNLSRGVSF